MNSKIKISDLSKLKTIKTLFDDKLLETNNDITKDDIIKIFSENLKDKDLENFKKIIESIQDENLEKIFKRVKTQYKSTHKFVSKVIEEEKCLKDSEIKIEQEEKNLELDQKVEDRYTNLKMLTKKVCIIQNITI